MNGPGGAGGNMYLVYKEEMGKYVTSVCGTEEKLGSI